MLDGRTREMSIYLKEQELPEPYLGSPIYSSSVAVLPNHTLQVFAWGIYVFVSSLKRTWLPPKQTFPLSKPAVTVEILDTNKNFVFLRFIHGKTSRKIKLKL